MGVCGDYDLGSFVFSLNYGRHFDMITAACESSNHN